MFGTKIDRNNWGRVVLVSGAIGIGVGLLFGLLGTSLAIANSSWIIGAAAGIIVGIFVGTTHTKSKN